jgi:hypothetical protein
MGRPTKTGLDYFPLDVVMDDCIELIETEHGLAGFSIVIKLWQKIYKNGYYLDWSEDVARLFAHRINAELTLINSVINSCFYRNIFNESLYKSHNVLTSAGIQKRYIIACLASKRKSISVRSDLCLLPTELTQYITEFTPFPPVVSAQSKVKETKVKENNMRTEPCATQTPKVSDTSIPPDDHKPKDDKGSVAEEYPFSEFWEFYDKKKDKQRAEKVYKKISLRDRKCIFNTLQAYKDSTPDKQYRKNPETYLRNRTWEDEIIPTGNDRGSKTPAQVLKVDVL